MRNILILVTFVFAFLIVGCVSKKDKEILAKVNTLAEAKEFGKALDILNEGIQVDSKSKTLHRERVLLLLKAGRVDMSIAAYRELVKVMSEGKTKVTHDSVLRDALRGKDHQVRGNAARALATLEDVDSYSSIAKLLKDPENEVRRSAVYALGDLKDKRAVTPLIGALADSWWFVRSDAAQALGKLRGTDAIEPLFNLLADEDNQVRHSATNALLTLVQEGGIEIYLAQLKSDKPLAVQVSTFALASVRNSEAIPQLLTYVTQGANEIRPIALRALGQMRDPKTISVVRQALQDPDPAVRHEAIIALLELGDVGSIEMVKSVANKSNEDPVIRKLAQRAIELLGRMVPPTPEK